MRKKYIKKTKINIMVGKETSAGDLHGRAAVNHTAARLLLANANLNMSDLQRECTGTYSTLQPLDSNIQSLQRWSGHLDRGFDHR